MTRHAVGIALSVAFSMTCTAVFHGADEPTAETKYVGEVITDKAPYEWRDGAKLHFFHEKKLRNIGVLNDRTHRKILIVDGKEAFVGGHCVVDDWLGDAEDKKHFADVSVRVRGPIVHALQGCFSENWAGETGELFAGPDVFPELEHVGEIKMHLAYAKPECSAPAVKILAPRVTFGAGILRAGTRPACPV